jgi:hypothetical protein
VFSDLYGARPHSKSLTPGPLSAPLRAGRALTSSRFLTNRPGSEVSMTTEKLTLTLWRMAMTQSKMEKRLFAMSSPTSRGHPISQATLHRLSTPGDFEQCCSVNRQGGCTSLLEVSLASMRLSTRIVSDKLFLLPIIFIPCLCVDAQGLEVVERLILMFPTDIKASDLFLGRRVPQGAPAI